MRAPLAPKYLVVPQQDGANRVFDRYSPRQILLANSGEEDIARELPRCEQTLTPGGIRCHCILKL